MQYTSARSMSPVINAPESTRTAFIVRVYQHLALAIAAFVALETVLFVTGTAEAMFDFFASSGGFAWLLLLGGVSIVQWFAARSISKIDDTGAQYVGLFATAGAQALIFAPFLYYVFNYTEGGSGSVASAAVVTLLGFAGLSVVAFVTRRDLGFLRPIVMWGFMAALVLIVAAVIFGFELGVLFSVAMIGLAGAAILYQTQDIIRRYPEWAHVAAAVSLFSSLMTMFWYVLRLFSRR